MGGTIDGRRGDIVIISPPYIASADELAEIADKLAGSLTEALAAFGR